jgi:hypothetical protein
MAASPRSRLGDQVLCARGFRGMHEYTAGMVMSLYREAWGDGPSCGPSWSPRSRTTSCSSTTHRAATSPRKRASRRRCSSRKRWLRPARRTASGCTGPAVRTKPGVCHRIVVEDYALPGDIIVLTDSHTPTAACSTPSRSASARRRWRSRCAPGSDPGHRAQDGARRGLRRRQGRAVAQGPDPAPDRRPVLPRGAVARPAPPTPASSSSAARASPSGTSTSCRCSPT